MGLYKLFGYSVEIQHKSCFFSFATFFTIFLNLLNVFIAFLIAYQNRGLWLRSQTFYEQPSVDFKYEYLVVANTQDPALTIACGGLLSLKNPLDERCSNFKVLEHDPNSDGILDYLDFQIELNVPPSNTILSLTVFLLMDFKLQNVCPLQMQSLAVIHKEFSYPSSRFIYNADISWYQVKPLPCYRNYIDLKYNNSLFREDPTDTSDILDQVMLQYFNRDVSTRMINIDSRAMHGLLPTFEATLHIRIPEQPVRYKPSFVQELIWAWPHYVSVFLIVYWIFYKIKLYLFQNQILLSWEIIPWEKEVY